MKTPTEIYLDLLSAQTAYSQKHVYDNTYTLPDYVEAYIKVLKRTFTGIEIKPMTIRRQISVIFQDLEEYHINYETIEDAMEFKPKKSFRKKSGNWLEKFANRLKKD